MDQLIDFQPKPGNSIRRVLIVDDESIVLSTLREWLESANWRVVCARTSDEALSIVRSGDITVAVIDYRLEGDDDGIRLGQLLMGMGIRFLLISGYLNTSVVVEAMKAGALDVIDKPLTQDSFINFFTEIVVPQKRSRDAVPTLDPSDGMGDTGPGALTMITVRWSRMILGACAALDDPRTVPLWGRAVGVSPATIEETCRLCAVTPHDSRDLARFLRALSRSRTTHDPLLSHFAVADERTADRLFRRAGLLRTSGSVPLKTFLSDQSFVPTTKQCLRRLAHIAANSPFFFG